MNSTESGKKQFRTELLLALVVTGLASAAGLSNLLFAPDNMYPAATDYMGHIAKVQYIYECLKQGEIPSWYPFWYNGSTVTQYYPPLSYYLMVPIYALTQNVMKTFVINGFVMMFAGGIGVWYFCRALIGKWCGLGSIILYSLQPFLLTSLYIAGVIAQGPIYALTPWFLLILLKCANCPTKSRVIKLTLLLSLLILSHAMLAYIIILCIMASLLVFILIKKIKPIHCAIILISIAFSGLLTAFWSFASITKLENPAIPHLSTEATANVTAAINWFDLRNISSHQMIYFSFPVLLITAVAVLAFLLRASKKQLYDAEHFEIPFSIGLSLLTLVFAFGYKIPLFQFLPMSENLAPGGILSLTAITGAISGAYLLHLAMRGLTALKMFSRLVFAVMIAGAFAVTVFYLNPYQQIYVLDSDDRFQERFESVDTSGDPFEKGRYFTFGESGSDEANIPIAYGFNIAGGWNIESSPQNLFIRDQALSPATGTYDFLAKNLAFWNVRYMTVPASDQEITLPLQNRLGFTMKYGDIFYTSDLPSSYFLVDRRNALIFGPGAPGVAMEFPYLVYEQGSKITDYSLNELEKYKLIYLSEPEIDTLLEKNKVERTIEKLVDRGVTVLIEPADTRRYQLFDVAVADIALENAPSIMRQDNSPIDSFISGIPIDRKTNYGRVLFGLDQVYYELVQNRGGLRNDVIGSKKTGDGEVIFIGMHFSQYLKAVYARNWGVPEKESGYPDNSEEVKTLFEDIFKTYGVNKDFWPESFPVRNAEWNYKGVTFEYTGTKAREMTLSVTYAPRWKAKLDGRTIPVGQKENLITLDLPAGDHEVTLVYGNTKYGIAGSIISLAGLLLFILFIRFYDIIFYQLKQIGLKIDRFLQMDYER